MAGLTGSAFSFVFVTILAGGSCGFRASTWLYVNRDAREYRRIRSGVSGSGFSLYNDDYRLASVKNTAGVHFFVAESIKKV
ncbi:hypothetical protein MKS82_02160 [Ochrobactrum sp. A-1]|nr:hypothetical protein [Ochrobactrum sp. A-1]